MKQRTLTDRSINHTFLIAFFERIEANNDHDMKQDNELCNLIMTSQKASGKNQGEDKLVSDQKKLTDMLNYSAG